MNSMYLVHEYYTNGYNISMLSIVFIFFCFMYRPLIIMDIKYMFILIYFFKEPLYIVLCSSDSNKNDNSYYKDGFSGNGFEENNSEENDSYKDESNSEENYSESEEYDDKNELHKGNPRVVKEEYFKDRQTASRAISAIAEGVKPFENSDLLYLQNKSKYQSELKNSDNSGEFMNKVLSKTSNKEKEADLKIGSLLSQVSQKSIKDNMIISNGSIDERMKKDDKELKECLEEIKKELTTKKGANVNSTKEEVNEVVNKHMDNLNNQYFSALSNNKRNREESSSDIDEPNKKRLKGSTIDFVLEKESTEMPGFIDDGD